MATYLDQILAAHRSCAANDHRDLEGLAEAALRCPSARGFRAAIEAIPGSGLAVIAEIKRRSPSKGALAPGLDPAGTAGAYEAGGATCLSVLTDAEFFGGSAADLMAARAAVALPVLRKDFTVSEADLYDSRIMGADAVLLIVAALDDAELAGLTVLANDLGLDALVEVHDERELDRALAAGATLIGVNQRDLVTFAVDYARAERVAARIPAGVLAVAESGVRGHEDASRLLGVGYRAVLVGESLVTAHDPSLAVAALRNAGLHASRADREPAQ